MATREQLLQALDKADAAGNVEDARDIAALLRQQSEQPPSVRGAKGFLDEGGGAEALATGIANSATLGAIGPVSAFIQSKATGQPYAEIRADQQRRMRALEEENPYWSMAGGLAGGLALGGGVGTAVRAGALGTQAAGLARAALPQAGEGLLATTGRLAAGGAAAGAATNIGESAVRSAEAGLSDVDTRQDPTFGGMAGDALKAGALGAAAGPIGGAVAGIASRGALMARDTLATLRNSEAPERLGGAWRLLAEKLKTDPATLRQAAAETERVTGQKPNVAMLTDMRQQGVLREIAEERNAAGQVFRQASEEGAEAAPEAVQGIVQRGAGRVPRTDAQLAAAKEAPAENFMAAEVPRPGRQSDFNSPTVAQESVPVTLSRRDLDLLTDPNMRELSRSLPPELRTRIAETVNDLSTANVVGTRRLTVRDVDTVRRLLRDDAEQRGWTSVAQRLNDRWAQAAERVAPGYQREVMSAYEQGAVRQEAAKAGRAGRELPENIARPDVPDDNVLRQQALREGYGEGAAGRIFRQAGEGPQQAVSAAKELGENQNLQQALHSAYGSEATEGMVQGGRALARGQAALEAIAPQRIVPPDEGRQLARTASAVAATTFGHLTSAIHRSIVAASGGQAGQMSEKTAELLAKKLVSRSPRDVEQAVAALERAGVQNATIAEIRGTAALAAGDRADTRQEKRYRPLRVEVQPRARGQ